MCATREYRQLVVIATHLLATRNTLDGDQIRTVLEHMDLGHYINAIEDTDGDL